MKKYPVYPLLIAIFPVLSLGAVNIKEIDVRVLLRPALISLALIVVIFTLSWVILRNVYRAAMLTAFTGLMLLSYGHVYHSIRELPSFGTVMARHRYLLIPYLGALIIGSFWIIRKVKDPRSYTLALNICSIVLLILPTYRIAEYSITASEAEEISNAIFDSYEPMDVLDSSELPDIYYIILDTYTRGDALENEFDFDNSYFLDGLKELGFYIADCSRSNYGGTYPSLSSALNLSYMAELKTVLAEQGIDEDDYNHLIKYSLLREMLESVGYTIVAFDTGYEWSRMPDADVYLGGAYDPLALQMIDPFESMFIKSTAGLIWTDLLYINRPEKRIDTGFISSINFPYRGYARRQLLILNELPNLERVPGPKFVFAHILIPHVPRVFSPTGEIVTDPGYYSGKLAGPINAEYDRAGYLNEIQFINSQMLDISKEIIEESDRPLIIVIQGDTGKSGSNEFQILNAYYFDRGIPSSLYSTITPVNTFRLILNEFFNTDFELLPDQSLRSGGELVPETSEKCLELETSTNDGGS